MAVDVKCPTCNTVTRFERLERDAHCFCRTCDYPLFWARQTSFGAREVALAPNGEGLRRLPGTEGWVILEQLTCPKCSEPNLATEDYCVRCGADLNPPAPVRVPVTVPVPPQAEAVPGRRRRWLPALVVAVFLLECLAVWLASTKWGVPVPGHWFGH